MNPTNGPVVGCEIELRNGQLCSIPPIGRCATCGRAFCPTHQAWMAPTRFIDQCAPCLAAKRTEAARRWQEAQIPYEYFRSGTARTALLTVGVPLVDLYEIRREWKTGIFGLGGRYVDVTTLVGRGWILGKFKWASHEERYGHPKDVVIGEECLTALLDLSHDDLNRYYLYRNDCGLVPVRPYSRGYEALKGVFKGNQQAEEDLDSWREIAQAVRRLTGGTS